MTLSFSMHDRKAERLVALLESFRGGAVLSCRQIAADLGVSHRTANRLIGSVQTFVALEEECVPGDDPGTHTRVYRKARF